MKIKVKVVIEGHGTVIVKGPWKTQKEVGDLVAQAVVQTMDLLEPVKKGERWNIAIGYPKK